MLQYSGPSLFSFLFTAFLTINSYQCKRCKRLNTSCSADWQCCENTTCQRGICKP